MKEDKSVDKSLQHNMEEDKSADKPLKNSRGDNKSANTTLQSNIEALTNSCDVKTLTANLVEINALKVELAKLPLDLALKVYFDEEVAPFLETFERLAFSAVNFSTAAKEMASINYGKGSEIRDAIDLVEDIDDISKDVLRELKCKINELIKISNCKK